MLEILYDEATLEARDWCADPNEFGNFRPKEGQIVMILPIELSDIPDSDDYWVEGDHLKGNPDYMPKEPRDLEAEIDELKARIETLKG